jgi:enamine deaminase RidA (YjgF/YER057c/UK114 family)
VIKRFNVESRYSDMAVFNGVAYLAGQVANDLSQDIGGQMREVLAMIDALLAQANSDKSRILMAQIYLADLADYVSMNVVWDAWVNDMNGLSDIKGNAPPRATVQSLLANPKYKVEVVVTAACLS